jgi:hypothetical protein
MFASIVEKVKGLLLNPVETFQKSRSDYPGTAFTYLACLLLVNAALSALVLAIEPVEPGLLSGMFLGIPVPVVEFFAVFVAGLIFTVVFAVWVHLIVYLAGGRKGIMETTKAIVYGQTPRLLFGWIPLIGFVFTLWFFILAILGIRELQEISTMKAILIVAIAVLVPMILVILAAAYFFIGSSSMVVPSDMGAFPTGMK